MFFARLDGDPSEGIRFLKTCFLPEQQTSSSGFNCVGLMSFLNSLAFIPRCLFPCNMTERVNYFARMIHDDFRFIPRDAGNTLAFLTARRTNDPVASFCFGLIHRDLYIALIFPPGRESRREDKVPLLEVSFSARS